MNYSPSGMFIWDAWYMPAGDKLHMFHLQRARNFENPNAEILQDFLGHSVTTNLIDWQELAPCLGPDKNNPLDDCQMWTGCAMWHEGRGYLYYTMRAKANDCREQHIGLAMSTDADKWERYPHNPIITPDPIIYAKVNSPVQGMLDCRDLQVVKDPAGAGWYGYYATRVPAANLPESSVIACVYSHDLINWKHLQPAFAPRKYACVEVPDVFELDGKWYMTCLTGMMYGNRGIFSDSHLNAGTIYAVSDSPTGPFRELDDNILLGAAGAAPLSVRSFMWEGERYILYTDRERAGRMDGGDIIFGTITTPKLLKTSGDNLLAVYSPRIEAKVTRECGMDWPALNEKRMAEAWGQLWPLQSGTVDVNDKIHFANKNCWSVLPLSHSLDSFILEADITLNCVAAGFCMRMTDRVHGDFVMLDSESQTVHYTNRFLGDFVEKRNCVIGQNRRYNFKIVSRAEHTEVYVDDVLKLCFSRYCGIGGEVGLFVDRGSAVFENVRLRELNVTLPK